MTQLTENDLFPEAGNGYHIFGLQLMSLKSRQMGPSLYDQIVAHRRNLTTFINTLYDPYRDTRFMLRTIINPLGLGQQNGKIEIFLLVRIPADSSQTSSRNQVANFSRTVRLLLGGAFPEHIWQEIDDRDLLVRAVLPLNWKKSYYAEIRRREEYVELDTLIPQRKFGFTSEETYESIHNVPEGVYHVHPYSTPLLGNERSLVTLLQGQEKIVLSACLAPTTLTKDENAYFQQQIAFCEGHQAQDKPLQRTQRNRAESLGRALLHQHMLLQDSLFYLTYTVASQAPLNPNLLEFIGLSISEPVGLGINSNSSVNSTNFLAGGYDIVTPLTDMDKETASYNMISLSQDRWRRSPSAPAAQRLRYLFDGSETISPFYLPFNAEFDLPGIETHYMDDRPIPSEIVNLKADKKSNILIGKNHFFGIDQDVVIPEDTRRQHTYIIGQTGTGKTTLMKTMILSDMQAGHGLAVIDPHGEMYHDLLDMIPEERKGDVVLIDPSEVDFPIGFNLLEVKNNDEREYIIKEMRAILNRFLSEHFRIHDAEIMGPVFFSHVQNNMLLSTSDADNPGTIVEFNNIFIIRDYFKRWLPLKWENSVLRDWVEEKLPYIQYDRVNTNGLLLGEYFSAKFEDFVNDPRIKLIFGQARSTIDLEDVVESNKILLVNLSKGLIGEANASLFGMMLVAKLNSVFMQRMKKLGEKTKLSPFYLYVDEFQNIATENFSILLSEARKFGLGMVLANQYMKQINDHRILNAIIGNVGTIISFRVGIEDAPTIATQFSPHYNYQTLCDLPNYQAILRTNVKGERTTPFNFKTILLGHQPDSADPQKVTALSREKYATPRSLADFLVSSSLDAQRLVKTEFYWENPGTPEKEQLINLDIKGFLIQIYSSEKAQHTYHRINKLLLRQIIHCLVYEKQVPRHIVAQILQNILHDEVSLVDNMPQYLGQYFEPALGDLVHDVRGIYNHVLNTWITAMLDQISRVDFVVDNPEPLDSIIASLKTDHWNEALQKLADRLKKSSDD